VAGTFRCCHRREAVQLAEITTRTIYRLVESGRFHFGQGSPAGLLVSVESLKELSQDLADALSVEEKGGDEVDHITQ
jgi:hypothetical protein